MARLRHLMTLRGTLAVPPALAYARLRNRSREGVIVHEDATLWAIHVEGRWWFHGEWRFRPHPDGCEVTLEVYSKTHGVGRLLAAAPTMQGKRHLRKTWDERLHELGT